MDAVGQPVKMTAEFELCPAAKGCVYRITHQCKSSVPLIGGVVEKFALGQIESGCADEFAYLLNDLKARYPLVLEGPSGYYVPGARVVSSPSFLKRLSLERAAKLIFTDNDHVDPGDQVFVDGVPVESGRVIVMRRKERQRPT